MLDKVLESCNYVVDNAKDVKINYSKIDELVEGITDVDSSHWLENSPFGILDFDVKDIVNFLLVYHSIGFSYWGTPKWTIETNNGELDGSYAMIYTLVNQMKNNSNFLDSTNLQNISKEEFQEILKSNGEIALFEQRYSNITNIGKSISENMNGDFYTYIKGIVNDRELFDLIISNFDFFDDVSNYNDKTIYFYKLAQLLVSDILHIRALKEKISVDYTNLVGCADYKIPQVLRSLGILEYSQKLSSIIDNKAQIQKDSSYEVEIRASMLVAINVMNERVSKKSCPIVINDFIWLQGQDKTREVKPYHLTRTRYY